MAGTQLTEVQIERMNDLINHVASDINDIQQAGLEIAIDWHSLWSALHEMRDTLELPAWD